MNSPRISTTKAIALSAVCLSTVYLSALAGSLTFAPAANAQYGLGLPSSARSGGATRDGSTESFPLITIIVPEDGAKTLASRPTFYWYITSSNPKSTDTTTVPKIGDGKNPFKVSFALRDINGTQQKTVFRADGQAVQPGLYKFTLPETAPDLVKGKVQVWRITLDMSGSPESKNISALIRRDEDPVVVKLINAAKNDLEKARIYAKNAYWYDAIDAYTSWLSQNPKDDLAITERKELLNSGLKNNLVFSEEPCKLTKLIKKLDESKNAASIVLEPRK
jgi:hypothetical protein